MSETPAPVFCEQCGEFVPHGESLRGAKKTAGEPQELPQPRFRGRFN
jgi:hypothetical protein